MIEYAYRSSFKHSYLSTSGATKSRIAGFWLTEGESDNLFLGLYDMALDSGLYLSWHVRRRQSIGTLIRAIAIKKRYKKIKGSLELMLDEVKEEALNQLEVQKREDRLLKLIETRAYFGESILETIGEGEFAYLHPYSRINKQPSNPTSILLNLNNKLTELLKDYEGN
mgnify:CR=1 FL=1